MNIYTDGQINRHVVMVAINVVENCEYLYEKKGNRYDFMAILMTLFKRKIRVATASRQ